MANIYIGNLSFDMTEEQVTSLFTNYGDVSRVNLITDRETGKLRGFGFVEMSDNTEGQSAIDDLNGKELKGQSLKVNEARPQTERRQSGGRGSGGRRRY